MKPAATFAAVSSLILLAIMQARLHQSLPPPSLITRAEALATADRYVRHTWTATDANRFHGIDEKGVRVDTPDVTFSTSDTRVGWWKPGGGNVGIPYMWASIRRKALMLRCWPGNGRVIFPQQRSGDCSTMA